jgi:outer membrane protein OmpA-like peptidoglycan-associated protein
MKKIFILALLFFGVSSLFAQEVSRKDFVREVEQADLIFYYGTDYELAAEIYEKLYKDFPDNANLAAKLGICYLNIDGKKSESLKLLQKAVKNAVATDSEYSETGEKAPLDSWLYLAIAYHQSDSLDKAIVYYNEAKKRIVTGDDPAQEEYIDNQIRDCKYAIQQMKKPLTIISTLFTPWLKDYPGACDPVISKNDSVFIFTQKIGVKTKIFCSYKNGTWQKPKNITPNLGGYDMLYSNSISGDGKTLILFMDDGEDGNLYHSHRSDTTWSRIKSVGSNINTIYWESHGFITPDGSTLYIASNRKGGMGGSDIWVSQLDATGTWQKPVNCGDVINTPYDEATPFYDQQTRALLFSSTGHISMGSADIFRSVNKGGIWTNPVGIPYAFNNTSDNEFFIMNNEGPGFITSMFDPKLRARNIYAVVAEDPADKITIAQGTITLKDGGAIDPKLVQIQLSDGKAGSRLKNLSLFDASSFKFEVKPGDYRLLVSHAGYKTDTINLNIPLYFSGNLISVNAELIPEKTESANFLSIKNILFEYDSYALDDQAKSSLEIIRALMLNNPDIKIEVAGYTDSKGSTEYNRILADKRAQTTIDYLTAAGIKPERLMKKAFGKTDFVTENTNSDGTDNPEGRKYNRRVIFGVYDPSTGVTIAQEGYTPDHLRQASSTKYSIVLLKTTKKIAGDYFSSLKLSNLHFIKTVKADSLSLYILGVFKTKADAVKYLEYVQTNGFKDAYIVDQNQINKDVKTIVNPDLVRQDLSSRKPYAIQLMATRQPVDKKLFKDVAGLSEIVGEDGFYRYICGDFDTVNEAKTMLSSLSKSGFPDAFVIETSSLK